MMIQYNQLKDLNGKEIEYVCFPYKFNSYCCPDRVTLRPYMDKFSVDLANRINKGNDDRFQYQGEPIDAIKHWRQTRESVITDLYPIRETGTTLPQRDILPTNESMSIPDPHHSFISEHIEEEKRPGLLCALAYARDQLGRGLDFQLLKELSDRIHSTPEGTAHFRGSRAYGKECREFYESDGHVFRNFNYLLAQEDDDFTVKAAKTYLDICFFHPFEDGNGRLAEVVLDFMIRKSKYRIINAEACKALFRCNRWCTDPDVLRNLVNLIRTVIVRE